LAVVSEPEAEEEEEHDNEGSENGQTLGILSGKELDTKEEQGHAKQSRSYYRTALNTQQQRTTLPSPNSN
jgi:hypothetical protein